MAINDDVNNPEMDKYLSEQSERNNSKTSTQYKIMKTIADNYNISVSKVAAKYFNEMEKLEKSNDTCYGWGIKVQKDIPRYWDCMNCISEKALYNLQQLKKEDFNI